MARRVKSSQVKKFAVGSSVAVIFGLFIYLASIGDITILSHSGDVKCAGTIDDPCIAEINFTANKDIFVYPSESKAWLFSAKPNLKEVETYINGERADFSQKLGKNAYSYKFQIGNNYTIKFVAYKYNQSEEIKWGFDRIDPVFLSYKTDDFFTKLISSKVDASRSESTFLLVNPTTSNITLGSLGSLTSSYTNASGGIAKKTYYQVLQNVTKSFDNLVGQTVKQDCIITDNKTMVNSTVDCSYSIQINKPFIGQVEEFATLPDNFVLEPKKQYTIKAITEYNLAFGIPQSMDWIPKFSLSGTDYTKNSWLWYNQSNFQTRYNISNMSATDRLVSVNGSYGINGTYVWAFISGNDSYVYDNRTGYSQPIAPFDIANETTQQFWENETWLNSSTSVGGAGSYNPTLVYNSSEMLGVYHFGQVLGNSINDSSGYNNFGTFSGSYIKFNNSPNVKMFGDVLEVGGHSNFTSIPHSATYQVNGNKMSIEAWVYLTDRTDGGGFGLVYAKQWSVGNHILFMADRSGVNAPQFGFEGGGGGCADVAKGGAQLILNKWYYLVGVQNGTHEIVYVNGSIDVSANNPKVCSGFTIAPTGTAYISSYDGTGTIHSIKGLVDELRIYNRTLTQAEITDHYNNGINLYAAPLTSNETNTTGVPPSTKTIVLNLTSPQNQTYINQQDIDINWTIDANTSALKNDCHFVIDGWKNNSICSPVRNISKYRFTEGFHNITLFANITEGTTNLTSYVSFTIKIQPQINITDPNSTTYTYSRLDGFLLNLSSTHDLTNATFSINNQQNISLFTFGNYTNQYFNTTTSRCNANTGTNSTINNTNIFNMVSNGTFIWVVDGRVNTAIDERPCIFKYTMGGAYTGDAWRPSTNNGNNTGYDTVNGITMNSTHIFLMNGSAPVYIQTFLKNGTYLSQGNFSRGVDARAFAYDPAGYFWIVDANKRLENYHASNYSFAGINRSLEQSMSSIYYDNSSFWMASDSNNNMYQYDYQGYLLRKVDLTPMTNIFGIWTNSTTALIANRTSGYGLDRINFVDIRSIRNATFTSQESNNSFPLNNITIWVNSTYGSINTTTFRFEVNQLLVNITNATKGWYFALNFSSGLFVYNSTYQTINWTNATPKNQTYGNGTLSGIGILNITNTGLTNKTVKFYVDNKPSCFSIMLGNTSLKSNAVNLTGTEQVVLSNLAPTNWSMLWYIRDQNNCTVGGSNFITGLRWNSTRIN